MGSSKNYIFLHKYLQARSQEFLRAGKVLQIRAQIFGSSESQS